MHAALWPRPFERERFADAEAVPSLGETVERRNDRFQSFRVYARCGQALVPVFRQRRPAASRVPRALESAGEQL
jgi:hypothetical protein